MLIPQSVISVLVDIGIGVRSWTIVGWLDIGSKKSVSAITVFLLVASVIMTALGCLFIIFYFQSFLPFQPHELQRSTVLLAALFLSGVVPDGALLTRGI